MKVAAGEEEEVGETRKEKRREKAANMKEQKAKANMKQISDSQLIVCLR